MTGFGRWGRALLFGGACAAWTVLVAGQAGGADRGREAFEKYCTGCHAADSAKEGPPLRGVFGRRVAADPQFPYSDALRKAQFAWDEGRLDRWLADPDGLVPDNNMPFRLDSAAERSAIIDYLKRLR